MAAYDNFYGVILWEKGFSGAKMAARVARRVIRGAMVAREAPTTVSYGPSPFGILSDSPLVLAAELAHGVFKLDPLIVGSARTE